MKVISISASDRVHQRDQREFIIATLARVREIARLVAELPQDYRKMFQDELEYQLWRQQILAEMEQAADAAVAAAMADTSGTAA